MSESVGLGKILDMQKQLMEKVPHAVRPDVLMKMDTARNIITSLLLYLSSCGHKPWRPNPLSQEHQDARLEKLLRYVSRLEALHKQEVQPEPPIDTKSTRILVSVLGIIEEAIEYLDALDKTRPDQLEEVTDIFFFYLESVILGGFDWAEVEEEYVRKHAENLERYRKAKEGDYSWDKRGKGGL